MQAAESKIIYGCTVIEFPMPMAKKPSAEIPATSGHDPQKHGNWAQWAAVVVALLIGLSSLSLTVYYHYADSSAKASDEHVNLLIDGKIDPLVKGLAKLTTETSNLGKAIETLSDKQSKETQKIIERFLRAAREAKKPEVASRILDAATSLVVVLRSEKYPATPEFFQATTREIGDLTRRTEPTVRAVAFSAQQHLAEYRSALTPLPEGIGVWTFKSMLHAVTIFPNAKMIGGIFDMSGVSGDAFVVGVGASHYPLPFIQDATIRGGRQTLDGFEWKHVLFIGSHIIYKGGEVKLNEALFINCTFELPNNQRGGEVAQYVALSLPALIIGPMHS